MKVFYLLSALLLFGFYSTPSVAQSNSDIEELKYRKWRISILPPLSTNGIHAPTYTARRSINLIGGYHGALDGLEIGLLFNATKQYTYGVQIVGGVNYSFGEMMGFNFAGLVNGSTKSISGVQFSGIGNYSKHSMKGIQGTLGINYSGHSSSGVQFAGVGNLSNQTIEGIQAAIFFNLAKENISGIQVTLGANIALEKMEGLLLSGLFNLSRRNMSGLFISGITNTSFTDMDGFQIAGIANVAKMNLSGLTVAGITNTSFTDMDGLQIAGIANVAKRNLSGLTVAGITNASFADMDGLQIASINASKTASGLQIGVLNIAKKFEGASIGVLSLYGNGRFNIDTRYSDAGFIDFSLLTGTHRFYNRATFGFNHALDRDVYRIGIGVGLEKNIQDSFEGIKSNTIFVNQEFSIYHLFEEKWNRTLNFIFSYKYFVGKRFGNGLSMYGGPTYNMQISRINGANDYSTYSIWSPSRKGRNYQFWVGFTVGLRVFKQKNLPLIQYNIRTMKYTK